MVYDFAVLFEQIEHDIEGGNDVSSDDFFRARDTIAEHYRQGLNHHEIAKKDVERILSRRPNIKLPLIAYAAATIKDFCHREHLRIPSWADEQKPLSLADAYIGFAGPAILFNQKRQRNYGQTAGIFRELGCFVDNNHTSFR